MPNPRNPFDDRDIPIHPLGFAPDLPTNTLQPGLIIVDMNGMYPTLSGVRVLPGLAQTTQPAPAPVLEAFLARQANNNTNIFIGTNAHLYQLVQAGNVIVTPGTTYDQFAQQYGQYQNLPQLTYGDPTFQATYSLTSGAVWQECDNNQTFNAQQWSFAQAANDTIATDGVDPVQVYAAGTTAFAPLGGNPPIAKYVTVVDPGAGTGYVVLLANLSTDPTGWVSSAPGTDNVWTLNVNNLSASGFLQSEPGPITALKTLRTIAVAFKRNAIYVGTWAGPPFVWTWAPVSHQVGTQSNDGVIDCGDLLLFPGPDDFYQFDGTNITPIPNALKEWFFGTPGQPWTGFADHNYFSTIQGRYDSTTSVAYWHFASIMAQPTGTLDTWICYNLRAGRWGVGHLLIEAVLQTEYVSQGMTYDQFAALYKQYQNIGNVTYGSTTFQPSNTGAQGLILGNNALYTYTGGVRQAYVQLGDIGVPGNLLQINGCTAVFGVYPSAGPNGITALLDAYSRQNLGQLPLRGRNQNVQLNARSQFNFRQTDYYHQLQFHFQSDAELQAIRIDARPAGDR